MTTWRALVFCIIIFIPRGSLIKKRQAPGARKAQLGQEGRAWVDLRWEKWTACSTVVSAPKYCHEWKKKRLKIITTTHIRRKIVSESWSRSDCPWSQQGLSSLLDFRWTIHFTASLLLISWRLQRGIILLTRLWIPSIHLSGHVMTNLNRGSPSVWHLDKSRQVKHLNTSPVMAMKCHPVPLLPRWRESGINSALLLPSLPNLYQLVLGLHLYLVL